MKRTYKPTTIYIVTDTDVITEQGLILTYTQAIESMPWINENKDLIAAGTNLIPYLSQVVDQWEPTGNFFQVMAQPFFRESLRNGQKQRRIVSVKPCYFGFRKALHVRAPYTQVHHLFDPLLFLNDSASAVGGLYKEVQNPYKLLELVKEYRNICMELNVPMSTSAAAFGSMMLRHPRFFPTKRAKVSIQTNAVAAQAKVGQLEWKPPNAGPKRVMVYALDQRRAHHTCASNMTFPHSNTMRLRGNHRTLQGKWKDVSELEGYHGLLYARVTVPHSTAPQVPIFPEIEVKGTYNHWIGTNELEDWIKCGAKINHVIAGIVTKQTDNGLSEYARYVKQDLEKDRAVYLAVFAKMLYFRAYGLLGMRPTKKERYYLHCGSDHECNVRDEHVGQGLILPLHIHADTYEQEPPYVNQVWRAMLEREARAKVIMEARRLLFHKNKRIMGIFADSIYVRKPYLLESNESVWKATLQDISFMDRAMYEHRTGTLIAPGVTGLGRERLVCEAKQLALEV